MDDFGSLARDLGFKPQGKSAPMAPSRNSSSASSFGLGSSAPPLHTRSSSASKSGPIFDDHPDGSLLFSDVYGGPPKYMEPRTGNGATATTSSSSSSSSFDYASIFKDQKKSGSLPVFDEPVYDDDLFSGLPGLKSASTRPSPSNFGEGCGSMGASPPQPNHSSMQDSSAFDELWANLGKKEAESKRESVKSEKVSSPDFDDLLPGFGRSSSPSNNRSTSESSWSPKPSSNSARTDSSVIQDPFDGLESFANPTASSSVFFTDQLEELSKVNSSENRKVSSPSVNSGLFNDQDPLDLGKSIPKVSTEMNNRGKDRSPLRTGSNLGGTYSSVSKEPVDNFSVENSKGYSQAKTHDENSQGVPETIFDIPIVSTGSSRSFSHTASPPSYVHVSFNESYSSPRTKDISESSGDIWLTVSEVPLFTQPTSAPPPSRPPPPRPPRMSKTETGPFYSTSFGKNGNEPENFAMDQNQNNFDEHVDVLSGEDMDANFSAAAQSAAAMKEAMDKAEAKFRQMRERDYLKNARSKETAQQDKDVEDFQQRELKEKQERLDRERRQREREEEEREQRLEKVRIEREREEKEREQRRLERERERARQFEKERGRQAVERATKEARERAAQEARQRAERAAVEKATSEARERAERLAVQRAQAEARERAAAGAKERAERAAAEALERANVEARERERAARAEADSRLRAERAAVERAAAEARERAAVEARERAAAAARANQQTADNDFDSFFNARPNSAPRARTNTSDPLFDTQSKEGTGTARRTSVGTTGSVRKVSSTTNIVDDLSSIFSASGSAGDFPDVEGETEERRRARLDRHQRTQERAKKALAEKNERDLQAQRDQAERHRIAETLDVEIKRWAAGKEGNLRALLSTLQYVLWPECGWQPVSLTDLITAASVKKVYRKATLCIHPDKVQQKGATLQQKYVAEKVFDLLKEASNKFNSEELF